MATANPGDTLARPWGFQVGRLVPGALADELLPDAPDLQRQANKSSAAGRSTMRQC